MLRLHSLFSRRKRPVPKPGVQRSDSVQETICSPKPRTTRSLNEGAHKNSR
jgi:hypothetical protein